MLSGGDGDGLRRSRRNAASAAAAVSERSPPARGRGGGRRRYLLDDDRQSILHIFHTRTPLFRTVVEADIGFHLFSRRYEGIEPT